MRQGLNAIVQNPKTFRLVEYPELPDAMTDLRAGFLKAVIYVPPDYSQRVLNNENPRIAFIEDNTDTFTASGLGERIQQLQSSLNGPVLPRLQSGESPASNMADSVHLQSLAGDDSDSNRRGLPLYRVHQVPAGRLDFTLASLSRP